MSAPSLVPTTAVAQGPLQIAQADVSVKVRSSEGRRGTTTRKVVVKRDRGVRRGWSHSRHYGATKKKVVIKKRPGGTTVVKKKIKYD